MKKICSYCFDSYEQEFDLEIYRGDFCSPDCEYEWLDQRGMLNNGSEKTDEGMK